MISLYSDGPQNSAEDGCNVFSYQMLFCTPVAFFTKEVNPWLAKCPLVFNGRLVNRGLTSLIKEATEGFKLSLFCYVGEKTHGWMDG